MNYRNIENKPFHNKTNFRPIDLIKKKTIIDKRKTSIDNALKREENDIVKIDDDEKEQIDITKVIFTMKN